MENDKGLEEEEEETQPYIALAVASSRTPASPNLPVCP